MSRVSSPSRVGHPGNLGNLSLRARVALVMALGIALALLLQGALGYLTFQTLVLGDMDRDLRDFTQSTVQRIMQAETLDAVQTDHEGYVVHARLMSGDRLVRNLTPFPEELPAELFRGGFHTAGAWRITQVSLGWHRQPLVLHTALTSPEFTAGMSHHRVTMFSSAALVVLLGALTAYALSGYALRPLQALTRLSSRIAQSGSLTEAVPIPAGQRGEIHDLAVSFNRMLQRLNEFRSREATFNRQAAHELRTPLTAMRLSLDAAQSGYADPAETLDVLDQELRRTQRLTTSILILAREGRLAETQRVDIAALARECAQAAGASFQGLTQASVQGDEALLRRALENLLENADLHAPGAPVTVTVQRAGASLEVSVEDSGPGLPEDVLPHLSEEFYRPKKARPTPASNGLGLSVVRHVMTAHRGSVQFQNLAPQGLRVTLHLPLAEPGA